MDGGGEAARPFCTKLGLMFIERGCSLPTTYLDRCEVTTYWEVNRNVCVSLVGPTGIYVLYVRV